MIGFYNYTVILTYLSLLSAGTGIIVSLAGDHPYWGMFFLLLCGFFDAFDGKVARTKSDRSDMEINYGIQIDSLSDIVAFGVLPACIGVALINTSEFFKNLFGRENIALALVIKYAIFAVLVLYILAALIRLAYFNVTEEERQRTEGGTRRTYTGLPVTSAALIFPTVMLLMYAIPADISWVYIIVAIAMGFAFLGKFSIPKPKLRGILIMVAIGIVEAVVFVLFWHFFKK